MTDSATCCVWTDALTTTARLMVELSLFHQLNNLYHTFPFDFTCLRWMSFVTSIVIPVPFTHLIIHTVPFTSSFFVSSSFVLMHPTITYALAKSSSSNVYSARTSDCHKKRDAKRRFVLKVVTIISPKTKTYHKDESFCVDLVLKFFQNGKRNIMTTKFATSFI